MALSRCAAALLGLLDAAWRTLNGFWQGGLGALSSFNQGQPNNSFERSGVSRSVIGNLAVAQLLPARSIRGLCRLRFGKQVRIYWISDIESGRLGIMPRPRGGDWLEDEIRSLKMSGVDAVVSLLERDEIVELDIAEEKSLCEANDISHLSFPIRDRNIPLSKQDALNFARMLVNLLKDERSVVIHCRQGVGRSALIAACILVLSGVSADKAFELIENARGCSVPDTEEQREWVAHVAESL